MPPGRLEKPSLKNCRSPFAVTSMSTNRESNLGSKDM